MKFTFSPWTMQNVIKGKLFQLIVLTWTFTYLLNTGTNKLMTYQMNKDMESIFTYNYSLGLLGVIYAIPAALFSIWIIKITLGLADRFSQTNFAAKLSMIGDKLAPMGRKMGISDFFYIDYADSDKWSTSFILPARTVKLLIQTILTIVKWITNGLFAVALFLVVIFGGRDRTSTRKSTYSGGGTSYNGGSSSHSNNMEKVKSDANWGARQKQKEADYAWRQAAKQGRYNSNTHHFGTSVNKADSIQREANAAKKRARNL